MSHSEGNKPTAVLFCPGRGSYARGELGYVGKSVEPGTDIAAALDAADEARRAAGRPTIREIDGADKFRPGLHLDGENAAELIYFSTMAHTASLRERFNVVAIGGNSLGWYTALPASGALSPLDGWRLVATMARLQKEAEGGQLLTTSVRDDWSRDPALSAAIDEALATVNARGEFVARSIRLGGHEVLAGTKKGTAALLELLPKIESKDRAFPFQLAGHGPFHTALCESVAQKATYELAGLPIRLADVSLIDGSGNIHTPWSAAPKELLHYTLTTQVTTTFDFTACVRTAMREFNPDVLLCAGPGSSLRAPVGHVVLEEGYRGIRSKAELFESGLVQVD